MGDNPFLRRYRDGYRVARTTIAVGNTVKFVGGLLALIAFIAVLVVGAKLSESYKTMYFASGSVSAGIIWFIGWSLGTLISANGQMALASLDSAVAVNPFLSVAEKARAMGFGHGQFDEEKSSIPDVPASKFCFYCGVAVVDPASACPGCGKNPLGPDLAQVVAGTEEDPLISCYHCGEPLSGTPALCPACGKTL